MPVFLPDGEHFLYVASSLDEARTRACTWPRSPIPSADACSRINRARIFVPNGPGSNQGQLLFVREQALMAAAFDAASRQLSGEPVNGGQTGVVHQRATTDRRFR